MAILTATLSFFIMNRGGEVLIDSYYNEMYFEKKNREYAQKLQRVVEAENLTTRNSKELMRWVRRQKIVSVQIYKDNVLVFDSEYPGKSEIWQEEVAKYFYEWETYYTVLFVDGVADVSIYGMYGYQLYSYANIAELIFACILFMMIMLIGIRKEIQYLRLLEKEIQILEGGNLNYIITVRGKNELSALAEGLNNMRQSLREQIEEREAIICANQKMITGMSHDLRTPLTSVMLYAEFLWKKKYKDEQQMREYVKKICEKTKHMKQVNDHMSEYSLVQEEKEIAEQLLDGTGRK